MGERLDIAALREKLAGQQGPAFWKSLDEAAQTDAFQEMVRREFPEGASEWHDEKGRRRFLKIMGASLALAGVAGCGTGPSEKVVPYVEAPEQLVPGLPMFFNTAFLLGGYAIGAMVESHEGRPTKIEGNPAHPASLGATSAFMQASILDLYDPDRSQNVLSQGRASTWEAFVAALSAERQRLLRQQGQGLRILTGAVTSPTLASQLRALLTQFPQARWHRHEPVHPDAFSADSLYRLDQADTIFSIGSDFLLTLPGSVRYARDFAGRRRVREGSAQMSRLYAAESAPTITGSMADHRLALPPRRLRRLAEAAAARLGAEGGRAPGDLTEQEAGFLDALATDLQAGSGLVVAGTGQPVAVQVLACAMNDALGATGQTVEYAAPVDAAPRGPGNSLRALTDDMQAGRVETLLMLGGNPAYTAPTDVPFKEALPEVETSVHLSLHVDETSFESVWHVPRTHFLEAWSDARAFDGTATVLQPLIAPLYAPCHSAHEVLSVLAEGAPQDGLDLVQGYWHGRTGASGAAFGAFWEQALYDGVVTGTGRFEAPGTGASTPAASDTSGTQGALMMEGGSFFERDTVAASPGQPADSLPASPPQNNTPADDTLSTSYNPPSTDTNATGGAASDKAAAARDARQETSAGPLDLVLRLDPAVWDGRFANNAWLQELPRPITKLVWDNAALVSAATAEAYDLQNGDMVRLAYRGQTLEAPVWIVAGHADGCVTAHLGYGRHRAGTVGDNVGFDAYRLRMADAPWGGPGLSMEKTGRTYPLVSTQHHFTMEGRGLVKAAPVERFREEPGFVHEHGPIELPTLYPGYAYDDYKWGMVIDQNVCIGCNACVAACQSENNIPVVGKEQVGKGREMHWLRIDRYYQGTLEDPDTYFQPVPCMQCEHAPCELVCPVNATVHDGEGLNVMVYNRCIGTRYCSNNCPYKVRRFNFLLWQDWETESLKLRRNPDVTVRSRGVMEKCTYCLQRITAARIRAQREDRTIRDGEVLTACQQACPTQAITFGDLNDQTAAVTELSEQPHNYALLEELGTRPRTTYLAHFRNPAAALVGAEPVGESDT